MMRIKVQPKIFKVDMSNPVMVNYCMGRVHAGSPTEIFDNRLTRVDVRNFMNIRPYEEILGMEVIGDSMRGSGIFEGDVALFKPNSVPGNGDLVVVSVNGECSLKMFDCDGEGNVQLIPTNKRYKPIVVDSSMNVRIEGVVVNVVKNNFR